jgi:hypothetical protein
MSRLLVTGLSGVLVLMVDASLGGQKFKYVGKNVGQY